MSRLPSPESVEQALLRLPEARRTWCAALHVATPADVLVGVHVRLQHGEARYRGFRMRPVDSSLTSLSRAAAALAASGDRGSDTYFDLSSVPQSWLSIIRSGSGYVIAGAEELFGLRNLRARDRSAARSMLSGIAVNGYVAGPAAGWQTLHGTGDEHAASGLAAATALGRLRQQWAVPSISFTNFSWPLPDMAAWSLESAQGTHTLVVGDTFRQVLPTPS